MANKLTKDKLDLLIEQVLSEKTNYPFDANNPEDIFYRNYDDAKDMKGIGGEAGLKDKISALAQQDGLPNKVNVDDFDELPKDSKAMAAAKAIAQHGRKIAVKKVAKDGIAISKTSRKEKEKANKINITNFNERDTAVTAHNNFKTKPAKDIMLQKIKSFEEAEVTKAKANDNLDEIVAVYKKLVHTGIKTPLKTEIDGEVKSLFDAFKANKKVPEIKNLLKKYEEFFNDADKLAAQQMYKLAPEDPVSSTAGDLNVSRTDPENQPFGKIDVTYSNVAPKGETFAGTKDTKTINLQYSSGVVDSFESLKGNNLTEKMVTLGTFAADVKKKNVAVYNIGDIANYMRILGLLSDAVLEFESSAAGTVFETFLALASKGYVIGGESGATDNVALSGGQPIYYSAKLYSSQVISQSDQPGIGLSAVTKEASQEGLKQGFVYIIGMKTELPKTDFLNNPAWTRVLPTGQQPKAVAIAALRLVLPGDKSNLQDIEVYALTPDKQIKMTQNIYGDGNFQDVMTELKEGNHWLTYIPILDEISNATGNIAQTSAQYLNQKVNDIGNKALKALKSAYSNLQGIKNESMEYEAKASSLNAADHNNYIQAISQRYGEFKTNYNKAIVGVGQDKGLTGITGATGRIAENKNKSIKDLDKLIERVIIESMNKK